MGKRKRITMKLKTPNPHFEKWLTEWRNKARKEGSKMEFCFNTALQSLKRYPLPLERGRDCKILKGFGDKLCLMIDNKLREHQTNGNNLNDTLIGNVHVLEEVSEPLKKKQTNTAQAISPKRRCSKEYFPQEGTGTYAILITLYTQSLDPAYPGFLTKQEIIKEGQHLSHTSFTKPDPGSRYTAWSSMKTLIAKNLVIKKSSPAKFALSEEGLALATKLFDKGKGLDCDKRVPGLPVASNEVQNDVICIDLSDDEAGPSFSIESEKFCLKEVEYEEISNIKTSTQSLEVLESEEISSFKGLNSVNSKSLEKYSLPSTSVSSVISENEDILQVGLASKTIKKYASCSSIGSSTATVPAKEKVLRATGSDNKGKGKTIKKHVSSSSIASSTQSVSQGECFIFPPNSFDIILYIDTCETSGSNAQIQDDPILSELKRLQIPYEVKKLKIGDYIWICRDRHSEKELVLPFVIERKRMDDFGHSIKDGRYHEQKFRLKKSGVQNVTYLIEKYGNNQHVGLPVATLYQAATNTAIQDGFSVVFTENIRHTARYLANFSSILVRKFQSKTLASCPKENISEVSLDDDLISVMSFKEFNHASSKNKPMRVSDLFVKMLIQIKGMSVDRALAIVEKYPTPAVLKRAYDENPGIKGEKLLATVQFGDCNKSIGIVLSKVVHQLFTLDSFT